MISCASGMFCCMMKEFTVGMRAAFPVLQNHLAEIRNVTMCASVQAFIPPSTVRFAPVMYEDSGPATNATIAAISSTRP
jgi:hypothetical protein